MVAVTPNDCSTARNYRSVSDIDPCSLRYVPNHRIRTRKAARDAEYIADQIASGNAPNVDAEERALFAALHTCAYRAAGRMRRNDIPLSERQCWVGRWRVIRDHLVERNLGLVYTMMVGFRSREVDVDELRSEAMLALVRAVEGFNPWRGFRFSTYACNAIVRALIHLSRRTKKYRLRFPVGHEAWLEQVTQVDTTKELFADRLRHAIYENLGELTHREALVIGWRFPLHGGFSLTLGEVGAAIGLSKERVRQIQERALGKLRGVLEADPAMQ